jgi:hypothetical protein
MIAGVDPTTGPLALTSLLAVVQMLGSPIWVGGFALFALLAPAQDLRRRMLIAVGVEVVVGCCAVFHFILRHPPY